jgi:hypothetical protein
MEEYIIHILYIHVYYIRYLILLLSHIGSDLILLPSVFIHRICNFLFVQYISCSLIPASTEKFFFEFWSDFSAYFPLRSLDMSYERKIFLSLPEVCFLDATRLVCLVLTRVRVPKFLNIAKFDLIFLHNTLILSVCLFVGLFVILFCLSCLSVCLYVCFMYSTVGMYQCVNIALSVHLSVFQPVHVLLHCPSVCLFVCVCLYDFISVCLYVYLYICLSVPLSVCLRAFLPSCIPSCLPVCPPYCLPVFLPALLPAFMPAFLSANPPACLLACINSCRTVSTGKYFNVCLSVCWEGMEEGRQVGRQGETQADRLTDTVVVQKGKDRQRETDRQTGYLQTDI